MSNTDTQKHLKSVEMRNVDFSYAREHLFSDLDLELEAGNIYGLLGKNGAGKTSLLRILAGLLFPDDGEARVKEWEPSQRSPEFLAEVYMLPEEFLLPQYTPKQYLDVYAGFYPRFDYEAMDKYMREFEIPRETKLSSLSYGQKKKFLLAFGLATDCSLFLLDEPTNGLDIPSKSQFRRILASALHDNRIFIISTHQVRDVENLIDPVIIIDGGKIVFNRPFEEIHSRLELRRVKQIPKDWNVLFTDADIKGFSVVVPKYKSKADGITGGQEKREGEALDLETLFNTVIQNSEKIEETFTQGEIK